MSLLTLIRSSDWMSRLEERMRVMTDRRPALKKAWPAVGLLLIAPGIVTFDALVPHSPVSHAAGLNLDIGYASTVHLNQPMTLTLSTMSVFGSKGHFSLRVGKKLLENFSIAEINPQPLSSGVDGDQNIYTFSGGGKDAVTMTLIPKMVGRTAATLQYGLDPPVPFSIATVP